jgi:hypothetical protein
LCSIEHCQTDSFETNQPSGWSVFLSDEPYFALGMIQLQHGKPDATAGRFKVALASKSDFPKVPAALPKPWTRPGRFLWRT